MIYTIKILTRLRQIVESKTLRSVIASRRRLFFLRFEILFQYKYKSKHKGNLSLVFTFLRFLSVFAILLLLINPKFNQVKVYTEKPSLILAVDNSTSIAHLKQNENALKALNTLKQHAELNKRFEIEVFTFDEDIQKADSIVVLKKGKIVERGSHKELSAKNGVYKKLVEMQSFE